MSKQEFLNELRKELSFLPPEELNDAINYYDEYISESVDEETALWELGSPRRVAEDFKKEYCDKSVVNNFLPIKYSDEKNTGSINTKHPIWMYVLLVVLIIGFGVPVLNLIGGVISSMASIIILALIAVIIIKILRDKNRSYENSAAYVQTCSDIKKLDINLGAGMFVIDRGDSFGIDGGKLQSSIVNGVWHISGNSVDGSHIDQSGAMTKITVPNYFTAENAKIRLGAGNLLIKGLSSYTTNLEVSVGNMEAVGLYSKNLNIKCGVGRMKADASMHGNVNISCGMGDTSVRFTNRAEEFNYTATVGLGKVIINGQEIQGKSVNNNNARHDMNVKCGMGNVRIDFGGVI